MTREHIVARLVALVVMVATAPAWGAPPKVVKTVPENGKLDVSPALREIRVEFDQEMDRGGMSWVGGGATFPKLRGQGRWIDARTCVLPVQLEPGHEYRMSINSGSFTNFRSRGGEAAEVYPISFSTSGKAGATAAAVAVTVEENKEAVATLRKLLDTDYSHKEIHPADWDALFKEASAELENAKTAEQFAQRAGKLLAAAKDMHIWLTVGNKPFGAHSRAVPMNASLSTLAKTVPGWTQHGRSVFTGKFEDGVGYVLIGTLDRARLGNAMDAVYKVMEEGSGEGLIVDYRGNSGGDEMLAYEMAGCFIGAQKNYALRANIEDGKLGRERVSVLVPNKNRPRFKGKVAVLMGPVNMSSAEAFLLMMKGVEGCKLIGERSYGSSGRPQPHDLGNGVTVYLPSWVEKTVEGELVEGKGIAPDVEVKVDRSAFEREDPVLAAGLRHVKGR